MNTQETFLTDPPTGGPLPPLLQTGERPALPEHLIQLPGGEWAAWRCIGLRGAGFPASGPLKLSAPECAEAADGLINAEDELEAARRKAADALRGELDSLRLEQPSDETVKRKLFNKTLRDLKRGKLPTLDAGSASTLAAINRVLEADKRIASAHDEFLQSFDVACGRVSKEILAVASCGRFREAVLWQNRRAVHSGIDPLLREAAERGFRGTKQRQHEALVASYLQRYCEKNDTIGFFGPVGWASFVEDEAWLVSRPGADLLEQRKVYFEGWGIDVVAETLTRNQALRPWAVPRLIPLVHLEGTLLYVLFREPTRISTQQAAILRACDGERNAKEIAESLLETPGVGLSSNEQVYQLLAAFKNKGLIVWEIEVPLVLNPDRELRRRMSKIDDESLRSSVLTILDELEAGRAAVANAAGSSESLDLALNHLEATFTRFTGSPAIRPDGDGQVYAARTLVYEDCRRDIEVQLGTEFTRSLGEPLSLLLTSARWLTHEVAASSRKVLNEVYEVVVRKSGSRCIEAANFWYHIVPVLFENPQNPVDGIVPSFQRRWADILRLSEDARGFVHYTCDELRSSVLAAFDVPGPGWESARYHSPDVMVAASNTEAIQRGDYQLVLGELHVASNTLRGTLFVAQHKSPPDIERFFDLDFAEPRVVSVPPKHWPRLTTRTLPTMINPRDWLLIGAKDAFGAPKAQALNIGSLVIERTNDELTIRTRDGRLRFDILEVFADTLSRMVANHFKIVQPRSYTPRITFDRLVVSRETWRFSPEDADFAFEKSEGERFLQARRWKLDKGMPRFSFYTTPVEPKPCYIDFDSPIYVEMFARSIRRTIDKGPPDSTIAVSEMLPGPGQNWLRDVAGNAYTSEFRIIALDPAHTYNQPRQNASI